MTSAAEQLGIPASHHDLVERPLVASLTTVGTDNQVRTLELRCHTSLRPDPGRAFSEWFASKYGHAPSTWDPAGTERAVITLHTKRVVTLG